MSSIKVSYHDDVRRFAVGANSFEALLAIVAKSYKLASPDSLLLKYVDDENELITISSTEELQEAQRIANADGRKLLKVFLEVAGESKVKSPESVAAPAPALPEVPQVPFVLSKDAVAAISSIKTAQQDVTVEAVPQELDEAPEQKQEAETKQEAQPEAQPAQPEAQLDIDELVSLALAMLQQEWAKDEIAKACRLARDGIAAKLPVESVAAAILANCPNLACSRLVVTLIPLLPKAFAQAKTLNLPMSRVAKIVQFIPQLVQSCQPQYLAQILRNVVHGNFCNFENIEYDEVTIDVDQPPVQQQPQPQPPQEEEAQDETWVHHGITCDMCEVSPIVGIRYKCTQCHDFDMCSACEAKGTHDETHVMMKIRQPIRYHGCRSGQRLRAEFVADKTLSDHTVVVPGANLLKVWQIRNSGAKWPEGTKLVCIGGTVVPAQGAQYCAPVVAAQPGEVVDVAVDIVCPSQPGRAVGNFRLQAPSGARFGDRVWVSVDVADVAAEQEKQRVEEAERKAAAEAQAEAARLKEEADRKAAEAAKLKAEEELKAAEAAKLKEEADKKAAEAERILQEKLKGFKYSEQIVHLQQLGFKDIELNMYLLLNHKGDLQRVVEWLLNNVQPM